MRGTIPCLLVAACTQTTPGPDSYTADEIAQRVAVLRDKVAFLDGCHDGDVVVRDATGWVCTPDPPCPPGFVEAGARCTRTVWGAADVMARVGDFWIDVHEASICPGSGSVGDAAGRDTTAFACSTPQVGPQSGMSWFQAAALCANAGKHLCTNGEWQAAALGTVDPGPVSGAGGQCRTQAVGPRATGDAAACVSRAGAEDMIGNLAEWTADWYVAGPSWASQDDQAARAWPVGFGDDATSNVDGTVSDGAAPVEGLPAASVRGGSYVHGDAGGSFAFDVAMAPSATLPDVGARCCKGR